MRAHEGAGAEDPRLCGGYGKTEGLGSLGYREPEDGTKNEWVTQRPGKPANRIGDLLTNLRASYEILRRGRLVDDRWRN